MIFTRRSNNFMNGTLDVAGIVYYVNDALHYFCS